MRKRILAIILAMISCMVLLSACGEPKEPETVEEAVEQLKDIKKDVNDKKAERNKQIEKNKVELKDNVVLSTTEGDININAYSIIRTKVINEEQNVIYLFLNFTNKIDYDRSFPMEDFSIYQYGIELDHSLDLDTELYVSIQKNANINVYYPVILRDTETDVEIKYEIFGDDGIEESTYVLKIK